VLQHDPAVAERADGAEVVADEEHRAASAETSALPEAFFWKAASRRRALVDDQDSG